MAITPPTAANPHAPAQSAVRGERFIPELLAPAGDWDCVRAAVENGADAIYFGLSRFNARMRAKNFTEADLPELMRFLHKRGVRGYVTFNTLVFANEWTEAEDYIRSIIAAGVDAAIVQDVGICRLIRSLSPDFPIHASTQMTVTSAAGVRFARDLGCQLVVLARECSIPEIEKIREVDATAAGQGNASLPLEVFVHGALCVAYSGQCLTSESLGGRSANRGECAQACRLPYELISDGKTVPLVDRRYLLSPQDLSGLEVLPELARSGVASLKIEGRLKSPEYVASITRVYRQALDRLAASEAPAMVLPDAAAQYEVEMAFSRGLYTGWFRGIQNQELVHARFGKKRGVLLGTVTEVVPQEVRMRLAAPLKPGDGVVFDAGAPDKPEQGGRVYEIRPVTRSVRGERPEGEVGLRFGQGAIDFRSVHPGDTVWKTSDPELERKVRQTFESETPQFRRPLRMEAHGSLGGPLTVIARDGEGHVARAESVAPLNPAQNRPLTSEVLREQLGRLGGTPFHIESLDVLLPEGVMLPLSELNRMRRELVSRLDAMRCEPKRWTVSPDADRLAHASVGSEASAIPGDPELAVLVRNATQLAALAAMPELPRAIYCEFEDPRKYQAAVGQFRSTAMGAGPGRPELFVAPPRIFKPGEDWILKIVRASGADGYLVRNYDHLTAFAQDRKIGDFSLNVANRWTADYFIRRFGLERVTASYDLNFEQLAALIQSAPARWFEATIHQHMPMFHMEHCVFCAFLSSGKDYRDCGRPCDHHDVRLKDRVGAEHPLKADAGCRNTVFNAVAQTGAPYVERMLGWGLRRFRIEFLNEGPEVVARTVGMYQSLLRGEISGEQLWRELKLKHQLGVTRGQMERPETAG
ncbi:MAG: U32 family peptidase [Verrucomicrobia bacterium]|nr:U32 family peptidase [Verrucomicrobiota bacterium]